ncbi:MAG: hypothetical protein RAO94_05195 [Candidatus Stygibacter australis]|nr:hypothetical protein [Candidatus Stygibacter australis]MDP8321724.1 hypothetical protein [Candidatus Stygibacter australis]
MRINVIFLLFVMCICAGLFGQYGNYALHPFEPGIIDARAEALGSTSILSSSGANYIFNNPAMLSRLDSKNFQLSCLAKFGKSENTEDIEGYDSETYEREYPFHFKINGLSFGMPYEMTNSQDMKIGFGVGYRTYYDLSYNYHYENNDDDYTYEVDRNAHGGYNTLVLGGGVCYQEKMYGGISLSFPFLSTYSVETEENIEGEIDKYDYEGTLTGTFFTLGGAYILNEKMTIGVRLRTGITLNDEYEYDDGDKDEDDIIIPSEFGLAMEMKPNDRVKLYLEYLTRGLSNYEIEEGNETYDLYEDSDNGYSLRAGLETGSESLFRLGFFMQSVPIYELLEIDDDWEGVYDEKPLTEMGFTVGFGLKMGPQTTLGIYGAYSFLNYEESFDYDGWRNDIDEEYSNSRIKLGFTLGSNF